MNFTFSQSFDFSKKTVLITGGAAGIGKALAEVFAERGARLILVDRQEQVYETAASLGQQHLAFVGDVSEERAVIDIVQRGSEHVGSIEVLINNAGLGVLAPAEETTTELWDITMQVNVRGCFLFAREVGKQMLRRGYGRIINISSQAALVALDQHLAYTTSKAALLGMTKVLALEWGPRGITTNAILPTVVETDMARLNWAGEVGDQFRQKIPTRRFAMPEEVGLAALYLASDAAGMINGANLVIDGGYTIV